MARNGKEAGKPAVTLPGIVTDQEREIFARRQAGETRKAVAAAFGLPVSRIEKAEWRCERDVEGRKLLAECRDSIEGLNLIGLLDRHATFEIQYHHHRYDSPELTRLSEVAALGRDYWGNVPEMRKTIWGTKGQVRSLDMVDKALALLGIAWSPIDRTPKAKPPEQPRQEPQSVTDNWGALSLKYVLDRINDLERRLDRIVYGSSRDDENDQRDDSGTQDLARSGNVVYLPGVTLAHVPDDDDGPDTAA